MSGLNQELDLLSMISSNRVHDAIETILGNDTLSNEEKDRISIISKRYNALKEKEIQGILTYEQVTIEENKIAVDLINVFNRRVRILSKPDKVKNRWRFSNDNEILLSVVGFVGHGKTVYISSIFNALFSRPIRGIEIIPGNTVTVERVLSNMEAIKSGKMPMSTHIESYNADKYTAIVTKKSFLRSIKKELIIYDYSGERYSSMASRRWLHSYKDFDHVLNSNIVIFTIDCEIFLDSSYYEPPRFIEINAIAVIQNLIAERRRKNNFGKLEVSLVFLKSDSLNHTLSEHTVVQSFSELINYCNSKFKNFNYYFAYSFICQGKNESREVIEKNLFYHKPPLLKQKNVIEPLINSLLKVL